MAWNGMTLTTSGRRALSKAQAEDTLKIHSMVIGDGQPPANFNAVERLVNQRLEITELSIDLTDTGCVVTGDFPKVDFDYYFRELGLMVETASGIKLYAYDNCGSDAEYVINTSAVERTDKRVRIELIFSNISNVTVSNPSVLYVSYDVLENKLNTLKTLVNGDVENKINALESTINQKIKKVTIVEARVAAWEGTAIFKQRINIPGIKASDTPIVSHKIEDGISDSATIKGLWKAYSCLDKVVVYDGYIELICFRKKPQRSFYLAVKEV
nr:MAG TPA: tail-collar fiber protein [Caudoviricetes sp.]